MKGLLISALLVSLIVYTGIELAVTRHEARQLFSQLEKMRADVQRIDEEWGRLLLERGTWSTHGRIEKIAREQLDMVQPERVKVVLYEP